MLTTNVGISKKLINCQLRYLHDSGTSQCTVTKIYITFDDGRAGVKAIQSNPCARAHNAILIVRTEGTFVLPKSQTFTVKRTQFSIVLISAYTIHKVRNLTLENLCVSLSLSKQNTFGKGKIYVAFVHLHLNLCSKKCKWSLYSRKS